MPWPAALLLLSLTSAACSRPASSSPPSTQVAPQSSAAEAPAALPSVTFAPPAPLASVTAAPWPPPPPAVQSDFCIDGVDALDESTRYVLPGAPTEELLIYLHGIVPPAKVSRQKTNFQTVVKIASQRANVAALMPRGRVGLAPKGHERWWGWPTSRASYDALSGELVAEMRDKQSRLEGLTGKPFRRVYLAGSSSGAYFVTALAIHQALPADGYGIISGATDPPGADLSKLTRTPVYLGFGTHDTVGAAARSFGARLSRAGAPVLVAAHPLPHGTAEVYLDEALAHFRGETYRR